MMTKRANNFKKNSNTTVTKIDLSEVSENLSEGGKKNGHTLRTAIDCSP